MSSKIKDLIARFKRPEGGSADIESTLSDAREVLSAAEASIQAANRAYSAGLLEEDADRLRAIRSEREAAVVEHDRATALVESLELRLTQVRAAEVEAALQADIAKVNAEAERVADRIRTRYPALARELVGILREITGADRTVNAMNDRLTSLGRRGEVLQDVQARALPVQGATIWGFTRLDDLGDFAPGWSVDPTFTVQNEFAGIEPGVSASFASSHGR